MAARHSLITGARITSLGTLVSRVLGMLRDMATAALLGMSGTGVMDAFVIAFRIPNTFRRLFGEGALSASYLPVLSAELERDRLAAWQLASVLFTWLSVVLGAVTLVIELGCLAGWLWFDSPANRLVFGLTAVMMPYMLMICVAAQAAATLQALGHFSVPALAPALLNLCWLAAVWFVAPHLHSKPGQAYAIAGAVLVAGVLQMAAQLLMLRRFGFRFDYNWSAGRAAIAKIVRTMGPMLFGLAVTQINTLFDSFVAWSFAAAPDGPSTIGWLGHSVRYPLAQGAAASIYYGERLYEFPLAILGIAVATAIYPLVSRHAARGDRKALAADMTLGVRLVLFLGVPASLGLTILAQPLARVLLQHGHFTPDDTVRAARVIGCYAAGVWAYCAAPVILRGFYALDDRVTPVRTGMLAVLVNCLLDVTLIWPWAEAGLAIATAVSTTVQFLLLVWLFQRKQGGLNMAELGRGTLRVVLAALAMYLAISLLAGVVPSADTTASAAIRVAVLFVAALVVYFSVHWALGGREFRMLITARVEQPDASG